MSAQPKRATIRFEDLGAPIQRLFKSMKGQISEEDMALVQEHVSVKDMARIFEQLNTDIGAEAIWADLRAALLQRKDKQSAKSKDLATREAELAAMREQEDAEAEEEERARQEEEEKRRKKAEKRRKKAEAAAEAAAEEEERVRLEAEAAELERVEQERLADEAARAEEKKRKKEEKRRRLDEELAKQQAEEAKSKQRNHKKDWEDFVASHPLEYSDSAIQDIVQKPKAPEDGLAPRATLAASSELLTRTWTPYCPHCHAKYSKPPPEWDCSMCLRKFRQHVKCWQPDEKGSGCGICKTGFSLFARRHHCRCCGRVVCAECSEFKAKLPAVGFTNAVKVCRQCVDELGTVTGPTVAAASSS